MKDNPYRRLSSENRPVLTGAAKRATAQDTQKDDGRRRLAARINKRFASKQDEQLFESDGEYNPQRFDYKQRNTRSARMFDRRGEVNAVDKRDALIQAYHFINNAAKKSAGKLFFYDKQEEEAEMKRREARKQVMAAALSDPTGQGFHVVGQELALPIKAILDYEGFARKVYRVRKLAQAELFRIPVDIRSTAWVVGQDGQSFESRIKTKWITPTENKVTSFPTVDVMDIYHMNFDVLDRAQDTARQEIELSEDKIGIGMIDRAARTDNTVTTYASLGVGPFEDVRYQVERHRLMVKNFLINRAEFSDVIKTMSTHVDPVTERELLMAGYIGTFMNADILTSAGMNVEEVIPAGTFYAVADADYMGEMGIRAELVSEPYNKYPMQETVKGWAFYEIVGFGIPNSRACAVGVK